MPKVSVIIPIYNVEKYIGKCLESLQNQTLRDIEVICVDDCSTDSSVEVVERFIKDDKRFILLKNNVNSGAAIARNNGMDVACGEYIYFIDSDDWIDENYLERMVEAIEKWQTDIVLNLSIVSEYSDKSVPYIHPTLNLNDISDGFYDKKTMIIDAPCSIWARLYKKSFIDAHHLRFLDVKTCNDFVFHYISHIYTEKTYVFKGPVYHYISRDDSITGIAKYKNNRDYSVMKAYSLIFDYFNKNNLFDNKIKLFCVWPFYQVDTAEKFFLYKDFFEKIKVNFQKNIDLYNDLERFFAESILSVESLDEYKKKYNPSVTIAFLRRQ